MLENFLNIIMWQNFIYNIAVYKIKQSLIGQNNFV